MESTTYANFKTYDELKKKAMNELWKVPKINKN